MLYKHELLKFENIWQQSYKICLTLLKNSKKTSFFSLLLIKIVNYFLDQLSIDSINILVYKPQLICICGLSTRDYGSSNCVYVAQQGTLLFYFLINCDRHDITQCLLDRISQHFICIILTVSNYIYLNFVYIVHRKVLQY